MKDAFAVWLTGLPGSGKSTLAAALRTLLLARGVDAAILDSDELRRILTPRPRYDDRERDLFYRSVARLAARLVRRGVPVIVAATASRRAWRDAARELIPRFVEVFVDCPPAVCATRDPKGLYRRAARREAKNVPGLDAPYEPPEAPEVTVRGDSPGPRPAALRIVRALEALRYIEGYPGRPRRTRSYTA